MKSPHRTFNPSTGPTNTDRAAWARAAVDVFMTETGTDIEDAVADLVADLCHLAVECGQDPLNEVRRGLVMYADERDFPPDGWPPDDKMATVEIIILRGRQ